MAEGCFSWLIERPHGISGYRPASWCAVCGRTASLQATQRCYKEGCPNICHVGCMGMAAEFRCGDTGQLRAILGIVDPIFPYSRCPQPASATTATPTAPPMASPGASRVEDTEDMDDGLKDLQKGELVNIVRTLRNELTITKNSLSNYRFITEDLVDKRRVLVEALSVVDTLIATHDSEEIQYRTVACSAKPHKIDGAQNTLPSDSSLPVSISSPPPSTSSLISPSPYSPTSASPPRSTLPSSATSFPSSPQLLSSPSPPPPPPDVPLSPSLHLSSPTSLIPDQPQPSPMQDGTQPHGEPSALAQAEETGVGSYRRKKKKKKTASRRVSAFEEPALEQWQQQRQEPAYLWQEQPRCPRCRRRGHTRDQCSSWACDYCQGRYHSSQTCRTRIADLRQYELIKAVRESGQETLHALHRYTWQLQQPSQLRNTGAPPVAPHYGPQYPHPPWPASPSAYAAHYGTGPPLQPPLPNPGRQ